MTATKDYRKSFEQKKTTDLEEYIRQHEKANGNQGKVEIAKEILNERKVKDDAEILEKKLEVGRESNTIAKQALQESQKANATAKSSFWISLVAVVVTIGSFIYKIFH